MGYASPIIWTVAGKKQIVQAGTLRIVGYDFESGKELWTVRGMSRICNMTPTIGPDNVLYLAGWGAGADPGEAVRYQLFVMFLIAGATGLGVLGALGGGVWRLTDRRDRLRLDRLGPERKW